MTPLPRGNVEINRFGARGKSHGLDCPLWRDEETAGLGACLGVASTADGLPELPGG